MVDSRRRQVTERLNIEFRSRASAALRQEFVRDVKQANELLQANRPLSAIELLAPVIAPRQVRKTAATSPGITCGGQPGLEAPPLRGHRGEVYHATFSPDGKTFATASQDRTVRLWDVGERRTRRIVPGRSDDPVGHTDDINWVTFSPDGQALATASDDLTIKLWDSASGRLRSTLRGHQDRVVAVLFVHEGQQLISCGREGKVILWDTATSRERSSFTVSNGTIQSLAISPDGATLAIAGQRVVVWDMADRREINRFGGTAVQVNTVAFSHDGKTLASGENDGTLRLWEPHGSQAKPILQGHRANVQSVAFAPDDRSLASVDDFGIAHIAGHILRRIRHDRDGTRPKLVRRILGGRPNPGDDESGRHGQALGPGGAIGREPPSPTIPPPTRRWHSPRTE